MSVCPVPAKQRKTDYSQPGAVLGSAPQRKGKMCEGGSTAVITKPGTVVTQTQCCPPTPSEEGAGRISLYNGGTLLGLVTGLDITGTGIAASLTGQTGTITGSYTPGGGGGTGIAGINIWKDGVKLNSEPVIDLDFGFDDNATKSLWKVNVTGPKATIKQNYLIWQGNWIQNWDYYMHDVVYYGGNAFVCIKEHTSSHVTGSVDVTDQELVFANETDSVYVGHKPFSNMVVKVAPGGAALVLVDDYDIESGNGNVIIKPAGFAKLAEEGGPERSAFISYSYSGESNRPRVDIPDQAEWMYMTRAVLEQSQMEALNGIVDGTFDWMKNATVGDWAAALAVGTGIVLAGVAVASMLEDDGDRGSDHQTSYTGTPLTPSTGFTPPLLKDVVTKLCAFSGYLPTDIDVTALPNDKRVDFTIASGVSSRTVLQNLAYVYQFDIVPSGGVLRFVPKYQNSIRTLTADDLAHSAGERPSGIAPYTARRHQGITLPHSVTLVYNSKSFDHNQFTQTASLPYFTEGQDIKVEVPFTLDDAEAKRVVETGIINAHIEQMEYTFTTDYYNVDLEPGDVITIPLDTGNTTDVRITEIREADDGLLEFVTCRADNNTISYVASNSVPAAPPATAPAPMPIGASGMLFTEVPAINSNDTTPRIHAIVHGFGRAGWPGAAVYQSVDNGASYTKVGSVMSEPTFGAMPVATNVNTTNHYVWDDVSQIVVTVKAGTLQSKSDIAVLNGQNWAMLGSEMIGFANATLIGPGQYRLTRLLRGRQGTEQSCNTHVDNELFYVIDDRLYKYEFPIADLNKPTMWKVVTIGSDISKSDPVTVAPFGLSMRPWAPAYVNGVKNGNNWDLSWTERPRFNNSLQDYNEINHDEDFGGFSVIIYTDGTYATQKRTAIMQVNTFTYTEEMQTQDFGGVQTNIHFAVYQMHKVTGGGIPARKSV